MLAATTAALKRLTPCATASPPATNTCSPTSKTSTACYWRASMQTRQTTSSGSTMSSRPSVLSSTTQTTAPPPKRAAAGRGHAPSTTPSARSRALQDPTMLCLLTSASGRTSTVPTTLMPGSGASAHSFPSFIVTSNHPRASSTPSTPSTPAHQR